MSRFLQTTQTFKLSNFLIYKLLLLSVFSTSSVFLHHDPKQFFFIAYIKQSEKVSVGESKMKKHLNGNSVHFSDFPKTERKLNENFHVLFFLNSIF